MPINFYEKITTDLKELKMLNNYPAELYSTEFLIPIPGKLLYNEILKRHEEDGRMLKEEFRVIKSLNF